ncbi:hypothetical protein ACF3OE_00480 [Capnocytophaga canis]|uniref:hypothetical protein n=1 Tax=Capnocytophaga canis TaxID=1848903 RepID=UPI00370D8C70
MKTEKTEIPQHVAMSWCWENGITIYPIPLVPNGSSMKICVNNNGAETIGKDIYYNKTHKIYDKIKELYVTIYNKNNKL